MSNTELVIPSGWGEPREKRHRNFGAELKKIQESVPFKMSSRGWAYFLEGLNLIHKGEFDKTQNIINE